MHRNSQELIKITVENNETDLPRASLSLQTTGAPLTRLSNIHIVGAKSDEKTEQWVGDPLPSSTPLHPLPREALH